MENISLLNFMLGYFCGSLSLLVLIGLAMYYEHRKKMQAMLKIRDMEEIVSEMEKAQWKHMN